MIAKEVDLVNGLIGFNRRQFIIPIYQRKYKWTSEQCNRLLDDIIKTAKESKEHFTGTIVYQEPVSGSFKKAYLVDGQQRVTTILLIIKALNLLSGLKKDENEDYEYVYESTYGYLYADSKSPKFGFKLQPSKNDENSFKVIMGGNSFKEIEDDPIIKNAKDDSLFNNFKTIYSKLESFGSTAEILRNVVLEGLLLLTGVEMVLNMNDDPQEIFESINSLGLKLSNADLIRNYLLMSNEKQKELYEDYWEKIQDELIGEANMENFIFNYLMMKKSYAINSGDIYKEYVLFANETFKDEAINKEILLKDLYTVAQIFKVFLKEDKKYSSNTNMLMQELRDMDQTTAYPFLMKVFLDKENGLITEDILDKVINLIITYLVRRTVCGIATHSLRGFMINLYNRVFKVEDNKNRYYEAIYAFLNQLLTNDRLRTLSEMNESLQTAEIYKNVKFATYLLYKIENGRYPKPYSEFTKADIISVEHIIPQTLTDEWIAMLGENAEEIHQKYLNTLGNLSLSSRSKNSIMSNESFITKRDVLNTAGSKFVELNKDIKCDQTVFAENEIISRENRLAEIICTEFDLGNPDINGIKFENNIEIICSTDYEEVFASSTPIAYKFFDKEIPTDSFSKIIVGVAKTLLNLNPEKMRELARNNFNPWENGEKECIHYTTDVNDKDQLIGENIRIHTGYNAIYCVQFTTLLMKEFGIDADQLIIYLKKESVKTDNILPKKRRVEMVRNTLKSLALENKIIYDPQNMPKSDDWIKFQTMELNKLFPFDNLTKWDGENFQSISYLEYNLSSNTIMITYKLIKKTFDKAELLKQFKDELGLLDENAGGYWHMKKYPINYKDVYSSVDKTAELKKQINNCLDMIEKDLYKMSEKLDINL